MNGRERRVLQRVSQEQVRELKIRKGRTMPSYLPSREADLVTWSNNFDALITASAPTYGLTVAQASDYRGLHNAFVSAYQIANDNSTRTPSSVTTKNDAKEALVNGEHGIRQLVGIVQNYPGTTNTLRQDLQITVPDTEPTPVPPPSSPPIVEVKDVYGREVTLRLQDSTTSSGRAKPSGVSGATILSYVGDDPPVDPADWKFEGNTTRTTYSIEFPITVAPGAKVWLTAFWFNPRQQSGPAATPIYTYIEYGGMATAA